MSKPLEITPNLTYDLMTHILSMVSVGILFMRVIAGVFRKDMSSYCGFYA